MGCGTLTSVILPSYKVPEKTLRRTVIMQQTDTVVNRNIH